MVKDKHLLREPSGGVSEYKTDSVSAFREFIVMLKSVCNEQYNVFGGKFLYRLRLDWSGACKLTEIERLTGGKILYIQEYPIEIVAPAVKVFIPA